MATRGGSNDIGFKKWKGIVTEQNIGQYEAEAAIDADNVEFLKDGTVQRRLGFELETGGGILETLTEAQRSNAAFSTFLWEDINGQPGANIRAIQIGSTVKLLEDTYPVSGAVLLASINLDDFSSGAAVAAESLPCDYAAGAGVMLIVAGGTEPIRVTVNTKQFPMAVTFSQQVIGIRWDRLEGENTGSGLGAATLSAGHEFDLRNSGWPFRADCASKQDGGDAVLIKTDPASYFKAKMGVWPKVSILYRALRLSHAIEPAPLGSFSPWEADKIQFGNTIPPKGHYITSAWDFDSRLLMQSDIGGFTAGGGGWVVNYWQVVRVDTDAPSQRFSAVVYISYTGSVNKGGGKGGSGFFPTVAGSFFGNVRPVEYGQTRANDDLARATKVPPSPDFYTPTAGERRVTWVTGFNTGKPTATALGNGRGDFVMSVATTSSIQIGDRFTLS